MVNPSPARLRSFVRSHTRLTAVPDLPGLRIHTGSDVMRLCQQSAQVSGIHDRDADLPYWAFPWAGGLAVARHLTASPGIVAGRTVLDFGAGSGLCAIVALLAGATSVEAVDVDPLAEAAMRLNARANRVSLHATRRDVLAEPPPAVDVILAGDVFYQAGLAGRALPWLRTAALCGSTVLIGDPGRAWLPAGLEPVASYEVTTSLELEDHDRKVVTVFTFPRSQPGIAVAVPVRADHGA